MLLVIVEGCAVFFRNGSFVTGPLMHFQSLLLRVSEQEEGRVSAALLFRASPSVDDCML